jgi:hypothetical protein
VRDGKRLRTDGPFAETREQLGGYFLVDTRSLDEAVEIAGRLPGARVGTVEVRPVMEVEGLQANLCAASGLSAAYIMWSITTAVVEELLKRGKMPGVLKKRQLSRRQRL